MENNIKFNNIQDKNKYSYKLVTSLILDKTIKDNYDISISTNEAITASFENKFSNELMTAIHILSNKVAEKIPDEMPRTTKDGVMPGKKIVVQILKEVIENGNLQDYLVSLEKTIISNDSYRLELFVNDIKKKIESSQKKSNQISSDILRKKSEQDLHERNYQRFQQIVREKISGRIKNTTLNDVPIENIESENKDRKL